MSITGTKTLDEIINSYNTTIRLMEEAFDDLISEEAYRIASEEDSPNSYDFESRVNKLIDELMEKHPFYCNK